MEIPVTHSIFIFFWTSVAILLYTLILPTHRFKHSNW